MKRRNRGTTRRLARAARLCWILVVAGGSGADAQVVLRDSRGILAGQVTGAGPAGVALTVDRAGRETARLVGWDQVKRVDGEFAGAAAPFAALSEALWRGRSRLERGDWLAAEPLLEPLAAKFAGEAGRGPTAAVVFEGLLRARLARGARAGSVAAWLELLAVYERSGEAGWSPARAGWVRPASWIGGSIESLPVVDARTGLAPGLPPIWVGEAAMEVAAERAEWSAAAPDSAAPITAELAAWYTQAGRFEAGSAVAMPTKFNEAPGPRLVRLIVQARAGDGAQRETARGALQAMIATPEGGSGPAMEAWEEAWCRAGIGRSLLRESEPAVRVRGVIQLLHVPARLSRASPYLSGVCLAEAAVALAELGDGGAASALKQELLAAHPGHPALAWTRLQEIRSAPRPAGAGVGEQAAIPAVGRTDGAAGGGP